MCPLLRGGQNMSQAFFMFLLWATVASFVESPGSSEITEIIQINSGFVRFR